MNSGAHEGKAVPASYKTRKIWKCQSRNVTTYVDYLGMS
jgi:hypothetical protein